MRTSHPEGLRVTLRVTVGSAPTAPSYGRGGAPAGCPDARPAPSPCEEGPTCVAGKGRQLPRELCAPHNGAPPPPRLATKLLQAGPGSRWRHRRPLGCRDALRGAGLQRFWAATLVQSPRPRPARPALHLCSRHRSGQVTSTAHDFSLLTTVPAASPRP